MKSVFKLLGTMVLVIALSGCVSDRRIESSDAETTPSAVAVLPTVVPSDSRRAGSEPVVVPTWSPEDQRSYADYTGPIDPDAKTAIPRDYLESMGLMPLGEGIDIFRDHVNDPFFTAEFTTYWRLAPGTTGEVIAVDDFRYRSTESWQAQSMLGLMQRELLPYTISYNMQDLSDEISLGNASYVWLFTNQRSKIYVAQFAWKTTVGAVFIKGDETLTRETAFEIFMLAATSVGYDPNYMLEVDEAHQGFRGVVGVWVARQKSIEILLEGTATLYLNSGCCNGVIYQLELNVDALPVTATILDIELFGDTPPTRIGEIGDSVTLERMPHPHGDYLVITMPIAGGSELQEITVCQGDAQAPCGG